MSAISTGALPDINPIDIISDRGNVLVSFGQSSLYVSLDLNQTLTL